MANEINNKSDVSPGAVAAQADGSGIIIPPDRIDVIAERLRDLFDLAAPLDEAAVKDIEPTVPFDPRWNGEDAK